MSPAVVVKRYTDPARGVAAQAHLRWFQQLDSGVRLPHQYPSTATHLLLERLDGRPPEPNDLPDLAAALGKLHGSAYARELHVARLDRPFDTTIGTTIPDFGANRRHVLSQLRLTFTHLPAAVYKDANVRNFILTASGPALVDFDDLTLAPFGYDLAKLVVSTAMTYGLLSGTQIEQTQAAYTQSVESAGGPADSCTPAQLADYAEVHHRLTARYLHRNGYQHSWPTVRPWTTPETRPR
uniref:phosphotransferase n=1 Tax=Paractinoplanes polyasparticus TaxID=2856853 RepID=UPI001C8629AC|nr:phosphotransferase [Actinoplanes polyasparticus]